MASNIKLKKSSVAGKVPTTGDLEYGEVALNFADGKLYYKTATNTIDFFTSDSTSSSYGDADVEALVDSAYINLRTDGPTGAEVSALMSAIDNNIIPALDAIYDLGDSNNRFRDLYLSDSSIIFGQTAFINAAKINLIPTVQLDSAIIKNIFSAGGDLSYNSSTGEFTFTQTANIDSTAVINLVDSAYVQARVNAATGTDSASVNTLIDAKIQVIDIADIIGSTGNTGEYLKSLGNGNAEWTTISTGLDSAGVTGLIDSSYIAARTSAGTDSATVISLVNANSLDSAEVVSLVDSAYVQARQTTYSNLSEFTNDTNYLDSTTVQGVIDATYIQANQTTYSVLDSADVKNILSGGTGVTYNSSTGQISIGQAIGTSDSVTFAGLTVSGNLTVNGTTTTVNTETINLADNIITLNSNETGTPSQNSGIEIERGTSTNVTLRWNETNDVWEFTNDGTNYHVLKTTANVDSDITAKVDTTYVQARQDFAYSSLTGAPFVLDSSNVRSSISVTDAGGDGSLTYNSGTGVITYTGPSAAEVRAHFSAGTGVTLSSGQISIGQAVGTGDSVTFSSLTTTGNVVVGGNLQVTGTTTTVNTENLEVTDNMIYLNAGESSGSPTASIDIGFAGNYNDDGSYAHAGLFRDATDNVWKFFDGYTPEPDAAAEINTGHASFNLAGLQAGAITGTTLTGIYQGFDSDFTAKSTTDLSEGTNLYYTSSRVDSDILALVDSAYIQLRQSSVGTGGLDSALVTQLIDSAYIQLRQSTVSGGGLDSAAANTLIDAKVQVLDIADIVGATGNSGQYLKSLGNGNASWATISTGLDSSLTTQLIDSAYVALRAPSGGTDSASVIALINEHSVDSTEALALFTGGTGVTISTGTISIGQAIGTSDSVTFAGLTVSGNLTVNGTTTTVNTETINLADNIIVINSNEAGTPSQNGGIEVERGTSTNVSLLWNETSDRWTFTNDGSTYHNLLIGGEYLDSTTVTGVINASYIQANQTTYDFLDSAETIALIDSAYVQARQTAQDFAYSSLTGAPFILDSTNVTNLVTANSVDSVAVIALIDSAYVQARQSAGGGGGLDSAAANTLIDAKVQVLDIADIVGAAGNSGEYLQSQGNGNSVWRAGKILNNWEEVSTTTYTASIGDRLIVDTTSAVTITLPASASFGDEIVVIDGTGNADSNNITIARNGHNIQSFDSDFVIDIGRAVTGLVYYNATQGWILTET